MPQEDSTMSISAFFHQESPLHPYFNTVPDSYHLPSPSWNRQAYLSPGETTDDETPGISPSQDLDMFEYSSLDRFEKTAPIPVASHVQNPLVSPQTEEDSTHPSWDQNASYSNVTPIPSIPSQTVEESGYSSVIIPNTIDDFLATHQVLCLINKYSAEILVMF